eukprot:1808682-Pleurochrysis_carterae.AAC.1
MQRHKNTHVEVPITFCIMQAPSATRQQGSTVVARKWLRGCGHAHRHKSSFRCNTPHVTTP